MKKKYINYLLVTLVLSLCILLYFRTTEGFQASPVDFTNYTGQLTGIRFSVTADIGGDPTEVFQRLFGSKLTLNDITKTFERCNGDLIYPYWYVDPTGSTASGSNANGLSPYQETVLPELITIMASSTPGTMPDIPSLVWTMNFTRNPSISPLVLTNQNVKSVFNNLYANLITSGIVLKSVILNRTIEFPKGACANVVVPVITPDISVNSSTVITGMKVETTLNAISILTASIGSQPTVKTTDASGNVITINLNSLRQNGSTGSSGTDSSGTDSSGTGSSGTGAYDMNAIKIYTLTNLPPNPLPLNNAINPQYANIFYTASSPVPDSVKQSYYAGLFYMNRKETSSNIMNMLPPNSKFNILSYHLSNPEQDITIELKSVASGGRSVDSTSTGSDGSLLQSLRNLLCI